ncbi:bacteriophage lambda tail assembly I family protein [Escherichia coli p0305293.2]|nr:bacteriophage lambda tail assembly I family protein [Escherichia coli p0305293.2]
MKTGAEAIRALATQLPVFRQKLSDGWYQVRIAGRDVSTSGLTAQLHETLPDGAVIHIVPRVAGAKSGGVFQIVLGAAAIAGSFFTAGATLAAWGAAIGAGGMTGCIGHVCGRGQYDPGRSGADAGTESQDAHGTDNG